MHSVWKPFDVVVVGAAGIDTSVFLYGKDVDFSIECNFSQNFDCLGQAGGYASRRYAALGKHVALIGFVGNDYHGTNGAGDGLAAGFLRSYLLDGFECEAAVLRGQIVARHICTVKATTALSALMSADRLQSEFEARTGYVTPMSSSRR